MAKQPSTQLDGPVTPEPASPQVDGQYTNREWTRRNHTSQSSRRGSVASAAASIRESLDAGRNLVLSQNAISTLLQPAKAAPVPSSYKPPTTRDIPPVTLTSIPHVESSVFESYLSQAAPLFQARQSHEADSPQPARKASRDEDSGGYSGLTNPDARPLSPPSSRPPASAPSPVQTPSVSGSNRRRRSSLGARRQQLAVTPLNSIPSVFFDENFRLENPRTFDVVTERSEVIGVAQSQPDPSQLDAAANEASDLPRKTLATNAILQEKLSWFLDTVEIHLISSISAASKLFFAALGSLKELHCEAADSVVKIQSLRAILSQLDQDMALSRLEILRLRQKSQNLGKLSGAVQQLENIVNAAAGCELLIEQDLLEHALGRITILEDYASGSLSGHQSGQHSWLGQDQPRQLLDLRRLKALEGFADGLVQLRARIGAGYQSRFTQALLTDLRQHYQTVPTTDTLQRWASASQRAIGKHTCTSSATPQYLSSSTELREMLSTTLLGLKHSNFTAIATTAFKEAISKEMKTIIRLNLPSSSDDDAESVLSTSTVSARAPLSQQEKSAILARNLRNLGPEDGQELLTKSYCSIGEALRRLQIQCKLLLDLSSDSTSSPIRSPALLPQHIGSINGSAISTTPLLNQLPSPNPQQELMEALDLSSLLGQAVDIAQSQISKVLKVRAEQTSRLTMPRFIHYFTLNKLFIHECEAVSGRSGYALGGVINNQTSEFIACFANFEIDNLVNATNADKWEPRDVLDSDTVVLQDIIQGATSDPLSYLRVANLWEDEGLNRRSMNGSSMDESKPKSPRPATIEEAKFILTESVIVLLHAISRFETLIACIPSITVEVTTALLDYIRRFNSQSCQLILGAGAIRSAAALKNINTKHLALASQALAFTISIIPYIREFVRRRPALSSSSTDLLAEFDKTRFLLQDHQQSIHEKPVDIMAARATAHIKAMYSIDMDADAGREGASPYMETLTKETILLYRALSKHMPDETVTGIMKPVWDKYAELWGVAFRDKVVHTEQGRQRLLRDAQLFNAKLDKINGAQPVISQLLDIVEKKSINST